MVALNIYILIFTAFLWQILYSKNEQILKLDNEMQIENALNPLKALCIDNVLAQQWWAYSICFEKNVKQIHFDFKSNQLKQSYSLGYFIPEKSKPNLQVFHENSTSCLVKETNELKNRHTQVSIECCGGDMALLKTTRQSLQPSDKSGTAPHSIDKIKDQKPLPNLYISSVVEPQPCSYFITVCSELMCKRTAPPAEPRKSKGKSKTGKKKQQQLNQQQQDAKDGVQPASLVSKELVPAVPVSALIPTLGEQRVVRERIREMFSFAYDSYMTHAYPEAELKSITCEGGKFDLIKIPIVTLVDTLDTLVIFGNHSEFRRAVDLVVTATPTFNFDVNVSVFETTIRMLGGLMSAHLMAIDPALAIYTNKGDHPDSFTYNNELLALSVDLGERLLPAFETKTGIPFGTVNLRYGVPVGETKIASTAGAGSLLVEFEVLSILSGDRRFGRAAFVATEGLYARRSPLGLVGKHINTETGHWHESLSGVGSNSDSFYEYLLKSYLLFRDQELYRMFTDTYRAIKRFVLVNGHWFTEVDMFSGKLYRKRVENLDAFWPGVEAMLGHSHHSANQLNTFYSVWSDLGFLPEEFDYSQYQQGKGITNAYYPLRPELIESTYHQYRTTGDRSWLVAGELFLNSIEKHTRTSCGYASVSDLSSMELEDSMPSFFLSETLKYLYLLFDEDNFIHHRPYIFSTEAHPFDSAQLFTSDLRGKNVSSSSSVIDEAAIPVQFGEVVVGVNGDPVTESENDLLAGVAGSIAPPLLNVAVSANGDFTAEQSGLAESAEDSGDTASSLESSDNEGDEDPLIAEALLEAQLETVAPGIAPGSAMAKQLKQLAALMENFKKGGGPQPPVAGQHPLFTADSFFQLLAGEANIALPEPPVLPSSGVVRTVQPQAQLQQYHQYKLLPMRCRKKKWWDRANSYDSSFLTESNRIARAAGDGPVGPYTRQVDPVVARARQVADTISLVLDRLEDCEMAENERQAARQVQSEQANKGESSSTDRVKVKSSRPRGTHEHSPVARARKPNTCYPEDAPKPAADPSVLKAVEINMGVLGEFVVKVHADGFTVLSKLERNTIEISNVGKSIVLVREYDSRKVQSKSVTGDEDGMVTSCQVQATAHDEAQRELIVWSRPCSVASFGASHTLSLHGSVVEATLANGHLCKSLEELRSAGRKRWWEWGPSSQKSSDLEVIDRVDYKGKIVLANRGDCLFEDKAVVAVREGATGLIVRNNEDNVFIMAGKKEVDAAAKLAEDRNRPQVVAPVAPAKSTRPVKQSEAKGAKGPVAPLSKKIAPTAASVARARKSAAAETKDGVVSNSEIDAESDTASSAETAVESDDTEKPINIPVVMLGKADGDRLAELALNASLEIRVDVSAHSMLLNSEMMGDFSYPKVWVKSNIVYIIGSGGWGTFMTSTTGEDWQLYLMSKRDMSASAIIPAVTVEEERSGQLVSLTSNVLTNSVDLYLFTLARQCPDVLTVSREGVVTLKR